jgi:hypothetical protein
MARFGGFSRRPAGVDEPDDENGVDEAPARSTAPVAEEPVNPMRMSGREPTQGYIVSGLLVLVGILDLVITSGAGTPKHETLWYAYVGIALGIALAVSIRYRNRLASPFIAIFGAFFVTLAKAPNALTVPHLAALLGSVAFAVVVTLRQRKDQKTLTPGGARGAAGASRNRRRGEAEPPAASNRPAANRRYTPPKAAPKPTRRR